MHITIFNISDHMQMYWGSYKNNENTLKKKKSPYRFANDSLYLFKLYPLKFLLH